MASVQPALAVVGEEEALAAAGPADSPERDPYELGSGRLRQFVAYVRKVFSLRQRIEGVIDDRQDRVVVQFSGVVLQAAC